MGETLTFIPPDVGRRFTEDFRTILFNEMNFRAEARYTRPVPAARGQAQEGCHRAEGLFPILHRRSDGERVRLGRVDGELLAAVDRNDQEFLSRSRSDRDRTQSAGEQARRHHAARSQEELFFHADPHPANLVIMPNNKVCFIDFGPSDAFRPRRGDISRAPLPHGQGRHRTDRQHRAVAGRAASANGHRQSPQRDGEDLLRLGLRHEQPGRRVVGEEHRPGLASLLEVARQYSLPASYRSITYFRTSFSYDSIITRLNRDIDIVKEFETYAREAGKEARERVKKTMKQRLRGPTDLDYLQMEEFADMITQFFFQVQRNIETPIIHFKNIVGKIAYIASLVLKLGYFVAAAIEVGLVADAVAKRWFGHEIEWHAMLERATTFGWIQLALIAVLLVLIRRS